MRKPFCLVLLFLLFLALFTPPALLLADDERQELWSGSIYTSTFRCGFCFARDGRARGVLLLKTLFGQVDEYHLYGTIRNGHVDVRHSSGHHVVGDILSDNSIKGQITLGTGKVISFKGKRSTEARLAQDDCAPLP
ncbi:MAG: hypothetical protein K5657_06000 [Desulfovibrio sp.]|nr:hypothetical protein [Desulfovibrio sp.]